MKQFLFFVVFFLLFSCEAVYSQKQGQARIDSLLQEVPRAKEDTNEVKLLAILSFLYYTSNPDEGIKYGQQALVLAEKLEMKNELGTIYNAIADNYEYKSDYPKALEYFSKSLITHEKMNDKRDMAKNLANIGVVYMDLDDFPKALEYLFKGLKLSEELGDNPAIANALGNIGIVYKQQLNYTLALEYFLKSKKKLEELHNKNGLGIIAGNIGVIYSAQKKYPEALDYDLKSLKIMEELGNKTGIGRTQGNIGEVYNALSKYPQALDYYFKSLKILEETGYKIGIIVALGGIGRCYLNIGFDSTNKIQPDSLIPAGKKANLLKSIDFLGKANKIVLETGNIDYLQENYASISEAQAKLGEYKAALESYQLHVLYKDSVFSQENKIKITNLETQRALDLKDRDLEIDRLAVAKKRNERGFFIGGIFIIGIVVIILFRNYKRLSFQKSEFERLQAVSNERTRIASDMHDDLGAGLTSIRLLSEVANLKTGEGSPAKSEIEKIVTSAGKLSDNLREIIWTMNTRYDKLEDFIIYVRAYVAGYLEGSSVSFQFNRPEKIPDIMMSGELRRNLFLCIKEAMNNIIKHAKATETTLSFDIAENMGEVWLVTMIKDNGVGIDKSRMNKYGNGLNTMKERLGKFGGDMAVDVDGGTKLVFTVSI